MSGKCSSVPVSMRKLIAAKNKELQISNRPAAGNHGADESDYEAVCVVLCIPDIASAQPSQENNIYLRSAAIRHSTCKTHISPLYSQGFCPHHTSPLPSSCHPRREGLSAPAERGLHKDHRTGALQRRQP